MRIYANFFKRIIDFIGALILITLLLPVYIVCYILIRINMGTPVLFTQDRPGKDEKIFKIYKFRSMNSATDENGNLLPDKDRITRLGIFLRKTSLDEIPQFFNILKGDMSFIGPRPLLPRYLSFYTERERLRHTIRPGITGLAQISGRNCIKWDDKLEYDAQYVEKLSFLLDIKIISQTIKKVLMHSGVEVVSKELFLDDERRKLDVNDIVIVGAGGLAREVFAYVTHCIKSGANWKIKGFIDDNLSALENYKYPVKIISTINDYIPEKNDLLILGVGIPSIKKILVEKLISKGGKFASLVHPSVIIGHNVDIGEGVVIFPNTVISSDVKIGDFSYINSSCTLDHDCWVGKFSTLCCGCDLTGHVRIGNSVFLSSHVTTVPRTKIGDNVFVGINSFVIGEVKPNTKVLGNPATERHYKNWKSNLDS